MSKDIQKDLIQERARSYLARDFDSFRAELLRYASTYFPDKIQDFSEASLGGLLLDMAAIVGDSMSFYLDHQFGELNTTTAVESSNIARDIRAAGVKVSGAAPSSCDATFFIEIPAEINSTTGLYQPVTSALPMIKADAVVVSTGGISFNLVEDLDFGETDNDGDLKALIVISETTTAGAPSTFILSRKATIVSGTETTQTFDIGPEHVPFREIALNDTDVSDIMSVRDGAGNVYYEVESLSQENVFSSVLNLENDSKLVRSNLEIIPAPRRFVKIVDPLLRTTTLRFGSGNASSTDDDIIPDPSVLALPLYGKQTMARFSIDPKSLLETHTLGIAPRDTTLSVHFRHGGGLSHNVATDTIRTFTSVRLDFPVGVTSANADFVRASLDVKNEEPARGGSSAPSLTDLQGQIPAARQMQSRVVSKQDLLARLYTLPTKFGKVYRAGIRTNPTNPLSTQLFILSQDSNGDLDFAPDALKKNLSVYINEFRLISDAIDILDGQIFNFKVKFEVLSTPDSNKESVLQTIINRLADLLKIDNFQIDQPILLDSITNSIINTPGVVSLIECRVSPRVGFLDGRQYSTTSFDYDSATKKRLVVGPPGSIFELKHPEFDIIGNIS